MPKKLPKVMFGITYHGRQEGKWWMRLLMLATTAKQQGFEFGGIITGRGTTIDVQRNYIADRFLSTTHNYIFFLDDDTAPPMGGIGRLLRAGKQVVSGIYFSNRDNITPVAYIKRPDGAYFHLNQVYQWERGEIVPVDASGVGCLLVHRSVFEAMRQNFEIVGRVKGGSTLVHKDDIRGKLPEEPPKHPYAGQVHKGVYYEPVVKRKDMQREYFPYFVAEYGRTEDLQFFENAARLGYRAYLDTGVECDHIKYYEITADDYFDQREHFLGHEYIVEDIDEGS